MGEWTKVVTDPLGLAGFALFVVFLIVRRSTRTSNNPFFSYALVAMAFVALLGGLGLGYWRTVKPEPPRQTQIQPAAPANPQPGAQQVPSIEQKTEGSNSPAVAGVEGDVNININRPDQSESDK